METLKKIIEGVKNKYLFEIILKILEKIKISDFLLKILERINVVKKNNNLKFKSIEIDTTNYSSNLCVLGAEFKTDKSPFNTEGHRHSYTPVYNLLLSHLRNKEINIAEIGILKNASIKMWSNYFTKATIEGFDYDEDLIKNAKTSNLPNTNYHYIDVNRSETIKEAFDSTNKQYDIIIDDSTHAFEAQIKIIYNTRKFLKKDGFLIIEDIYTHKKEYSEENYYKRIKEIQSEFTEIFFVKCNHANNYSGFYLNHKILIFKK